MMKLVKVFATLFLLLAVGTVSAQKGKDGGIYMAGVSASFTDSLIYFTDIQFVDSVVLTKEKMLPSREDYSNQLDNYLEHVKGQPNRVCFVYFDKKKGKLDKKIKKMKSKYLKDGKGVLKQVDADFKFTKPVEY